MKIEIKNLNKRIGKTYILKNISLNFEEGAINVLIGPNGAGKTTLLRIIGLLDTPTAGEIFYDGKSSKNFSSQDSLNYRRCMGFVFQNPLILAGTVYQNIVYGLKLRSLKVEKDKLKEIISQVGLGDKIQEDAKRLSGGEKQRLQLARVLVMNPNLFLLDEPTSNLDPISVKKIEETITRLAKEGKTIILSTHNLLQAKKLGSKIFFLKEGEIIQEGDSHQIFTTPLSTEVAEFSLSENIIIGKIIKEGEEKYLVNDNLKISIITNLEGEVAAIIRPEEILISKTPILSSARNCLKGKIKEIKDIGPFYSVITTFNNLSLTSFVTKHSASSLNLKIEDEIYLIFKATSVHILKRITENSLLSFIGSDP